MFHMTLVFGILISGFSSGRLVAESDTSFTPGGKVITQVFNRTLLEIRDAGTRYGMYINRAHFGYQQQFSPEWSGTIVIDAGRPTVFGNLTSIDSSGKGNPLSYSYKEGSYYTMSLKFSFLEYKISQQFKIQAGGILQNHYITQEKIWGYRYVMETFQDRYFGTPSGDLGIIAYYSPSSFLAVDLAVTNGEGFRLTQDQSGAVKIASGVDLKPFQDAIIRIYYDHTASGDSSKTASQQLVSVLAAYHLPGRFRLGAEYNHHFNHGCQEKCALYGISMYGSVYSGEKTALFLRYDRLRSNKTNGSDQYWNIEKDGEAFVGGIHYQAVRNISLSLSYQGWKPLDNQYAYSSIFAFCFEYKF
ncbi:MAG TPA: hypothetical protein P5531_01295 [Bacteroidales bacterium]|nr:hypothetical protein [Bacteroidales bacterium]HSA42289.1 hypothetical protein [Bacteroidales bacterium]